MGSFISLSAGVNGDLLQQVLPLLDIAEGEAAAKALLARNPTPEAFQVVQRGDHWYVVGDWDAFTHWYKRNIAFC